MITSYCNKLYIFAFIFLYTTFSWGQIRMDTFSSEELSKWDGYTYPIILPAEGLTEAERSLCETLVRANDIFSKHTHINQVLNGLTPVMAKYWGDNAAISISFSSSSTPKKNRCIYQIIVRRSENQQLQLTISGPSSTVADQDGHVTRITMIDPMNEELGMDLLFHKNGRLTNLAYRNRQLSKVKREVTWSEDGKLIQERVIDKPEPFVIRKGT